MADNSWDYGAGEKIDQKILDDYESPDFDISEVADDYEPERFYDAADNDGDKEDSFINPDEKLKDWDFEGIQVEKHSKGSRRRRKKEERKAAEKQAAVTEKKEEATPWADDARAAEEARKAEEEAKAAEEARKAEEEAKAAEEARKAEEEAKAAEEARKAEEEQQAAFERISKTVQAPIASAITGDPPAAEEVSREEFHDANSGEESHGD